MDKKQVIHCYAVYSYTTDDGYGERVVARFMNESEAIDFAKSPYGRCPHGEQGTVRSETIHIYYSAEDAIADLVDEEKKMILQKLTKRERQILGLEKE